MPTDEHRRCETCGGPIPPRAPSGVCKACLATALTTDLGMEETPPRRTEGPAELVVPGYDLGQLLGEGASGEVWFAREREAPRREVALKILKPELVAGAAGVRFEAEMSALALMDHPGIARVYGSGRTDDGRPYFAMERVEGAPITEICDSQKLGVRERLVLFQKLCEAMAHAHRRGIIHRDLKPSNVLVASSRERDESVCQPKVIDFGIAKATENLLTERTLLTRANVFLGTPGYMSPEQAAMRSEAIDTRTDIYSLGVVLYELLTGARPFAFTEARDLPYDEILKRIRTEDPPRPSAVERGREGAEKGRLSPDLDWIVMKALEKDPERRYESADAFARDIANFLEGDAILARPPTVSYRVRKYVRKHSLPVAAITAVALAMIAGTVVSVVMYLRAEENARLARESDVRGRETFSRADFKQATPLLEDQQPALAVAHLARAVRTDPENHAAATRLLYTLASNNWALPQASLPLNGHHAFSADGSRIAVASGARPGAASFNPVMKIFAVKDGRELHHCGLDADANNLALGPDGRTLAVGTPIGTVSLWDIETGEMVRHLPRDRVENCSQIAFSRSGDRVAVADFHNGTAQVWQIPEKILLHTFVVGVEGFYGGKVCFSDDGRLLAFGGGPALRVFDLETGKAISRFLRHKGEISGVAFLPGGDLVTWSHDATARVWDLASGEAKRTLTHEREVICGALSPDGSRLLTGTGGVRTRGESGVVRLWDLAEGRVLGSVIRHPGSVNTVRFSSDGSKALSGSEIGGLGDGAVRVFDAWNGELLAPPIYHPRGALVAAFSPDGSQVAISSRHLQLAVWKLQQGKLRRLRLPHPGTVWRAVFEDEGERQSVLTITHNGVARRWDGRTGMLVGGPETAGPVVVAAHAARGRDHLRQGFFGRREIVVESAIAPRFREGGVASAAASEDGHLLVTGCRDGKVRFWALDSGEEWRAPLEHGENDPVTAVALDAAGRQLISAGKSGRLTCWDLASGDLLGSVKAHEAEVRVVAFAPDGGTIASGAVDGSARLWWRDRKAELSPVLGHGKRINHLAFSPDGSILACSGEENAARLWEVESGDALGGAMAHIDRATYGNFLLWSPDGRWLVSAGSHDNTARLWDVQSGAMASKPMEHHFAATAVALRPDGQALLFGDRSARVWHLATGEPLTPLLGQDGHPDGGASSAAFDASGRRFLTGTKHGSVFVWDLPDSREPLPEWFLDYAEALGGFRFRAGVLEQVAGASLGGTRQAVRARIPDGNQSGARWMRWLVADVSERVVSPEAEVTFDELAQRLVREGTIDALREAHHLRPGDAELTARLGAKYAGSGEKQFGNFLVARAHEQAPDSLVVERERVRVMLTGEEQAAEGLLAAARLIVAHPEDAECWLVMGRAMEMGHWHSGEPVAYEQARLLATKSEADALATRAAAARDRVRPGQAGSARERFDQAVSAAEERAQRLREAFGAMLADDPAAAIAKVAKESAEHPASAAQWAMRGEVALLVAQLAEASGDQANGQRYREASCAALSCGTLCATRRRDLEGVLAGSGAQEREESWWMERGSAGWAYLAGETARIPPDDWAQVDFDDADWLRGAAPLGYGDDEETVIDDGARDGKRVPAAYFRREFRVDDAAAVSRLRLRIRRDDGALVFLNGREIFRTNLPEGEVRPETLALEVVGGESEKRFIDALLPVDALRSGRNVVAVEVHQVNATSSDMMMDLELGPGVPPLHEQLAETDLDQAAALLGLGELDALWLRGRLAIEQDAFARARDHFEELWKRAPQSSNVANNLGYVGVQLGDLEEAELLFARGLELAREQGSGEATLERNLNYVRARLGKEE